MRFTRMIAGLSAACLMLSGSGAAFAPLTGSAVCTAAEAAAGVVNGLKYTTENGYGMITGFTDDIPADLTIPEEIGGKDVTRIDNNAFRDCTVLRSVTLPDTVEALGFACFSGCTNLAEIKFPERISDFGQYAVYGTKWLADQQAKDPMVIAANILIDGTGFTGEVTVPDSVWCIGIQAFKDNTGLTGITLPETLGRIENWAFDGCTGLKEVALPGTLDIFIRRGCFRNCTGLESVVLGDGIRKIEDDTFTGCTSLKSVSFPPTMERIGSSFSGCSALKAVTIPANVKLVDPEAFTDCKNLETVTVEGYYTYLSDQDWNAVAFSNSGHWADDFTFTGKLRGLNGSLAQEYAEHFNIEFEPAGEAPTSGECGGGLTWSLTGDTLTIADNGKMDDYTGLMKVNGEITGSSYQDVAPWFMYRDRIKNVNVGPAVIDIASGALADMTAMESVTFENPNCVIPTGKFTISNGVDEAGKRHYSGVIRGYDGSTAQGYADRNDIPFESLGESPVLIMTTAPMTSAIPGTTIGGDHCDITTPAKATVISGVTTASAAKTTKTVSTATAAAVTGTGKQTTATTAATTRIPGTTATTAKTTGVTEMFPEGTMTAVQAVTSAPDDTFRGKCGESATWAYNFVLQNLEIEGSGDMADYDINEQENATWYPYAAEDDPYFSHEIKKIRISDSITGIGAGAFFGCASVENVVVPESVGRIGENAFYLCGGLKRIVILNPECRIADTEWTISSGIKENHAFFNGTIVGFRDSTAQKYAQKYGYRFEDLTVVPDSKAPVNGMEIALKLVPYLKTDGYTAAEQAEYQKQADEFMKKVAKISVSGDLVHVNEADPANSEFFYRITDTLKEDAAEIAALSQYDSAPLTCRVQTCEAYDKTTGKAEAEFQFLDASGNVLLTVDAEPVAWVVRDGLKTCYDNYMIVYDLSRDNGAEPSGQNPAVRTLNSKTAGEQYTLADYDCETLLGDTDGDSDVSVIDAQLALKAYTERISGKDAGLTRAQIQASDIDRDGAVSVEDVQLILKYYTENTVAGKTVTWAALRNA